MSEIDIRHDNTPAIPAPAPQQQITTKSALVIWAEEARVVANIADSIAKTPFAGALRGKPLEVTAVILAGNELGLQPMAALKSVDIIQGQPALRAHAMRGLLQSKGHEIELIESDDQHCVMRGRRKGSEAWQEVVWDIPRARLLGLLGKDQWKKQPKTMLIARATPLGRRHHRRAGRAARGPAGRRGRPDRRHLRVAAQQRHRRRRLARDPRNPAVAPDALTAPGLSRGRLPQGDHRHDQQHTHRLR